MFPLPVNPTVVALTDANGKVLKVANNIATLPEFAVKVTTDPKVFEEEAKGKTFNQDVQ